MNAALPGGLKLASETILRRNEDFDTYGMLDPEEMQLLDEFEGDDKVRFDSIRKSSFGNDGLNIAKRLIEKGAFSTDQHFRKAFKERKVSFVRLTEAYREERLFSEFLDNLKRAAGQVKAMEEFARLSGTFDDDTEERPVERSSLLANSVSASSVQSLAKKGVFEIYEMVRSRIGTETEGEETRPLFELADFQESALDDIRKQFARFPAVLLHGITSSGKTEIYIHLIRDQLQQGKQVLYLLPEIALTTQIIRRLKRVFGNQVGIYHSKYSDNERVEVYRNLAGLTDHSPFQLVLGVRSAVFLPFDNLGLVIVDEEHESTYKQSDPAPRYHARDAAMIMGVFTGAKVLMGSATPSFESLYNTMNGKYGIVKLDRRFGDIELPEMIIADVAQARKRKQLKSHFTPELIGALEETLGEGKQAILFQNRRGFSNYLHCNSCGTVLKCINCDVSMTYHKYNHEMMCHYCGYHIPVPKQCDECHSPTMEMRGFGTEKIEEDIASLFPDATIGRLDLDRLKTRKAFEKLISEFESGKIQVLVGTQLVTKGLDFENVNLVGVVDADSMLFFPDFRAFERSYQLMVQVSGRAGRRTSRGKVIIQTMDPTHPVIQYLMKDEFGPFFDDQMSERKLFRYPPFVRLIRLTLKHEIPSILDGGAVFLANELREIFGRRILGPQQPVVGRTHGKYIRQVIIKVEKEASVDKAKKLIREILEIWSANPVYKQIRLNVDVDPL